MEQPSDEIIRRAQSGDAEAFCDIVGLYERPLFGFVYRILWKTEHGGEVEDVVQDIFLKVYSHIGAFRTASGTAFSTWVFAIARNHCISLLRKRIGPLSLAADLESAEFVADRRTANPHQVACRAETERRVAAAIAALPEDQRSALVLRSYEEMAYDEIAAVQGCSVGTAKSRVWRAREKLAAELGDLL
jgi:RNA polymerase sigma-70 factor, ECF subfamily